MAKIKSKVFEKVSGSIKDGDLTFRTWKERIVAEKKPIPPRHVTKKRYRVRAIYGKLVNAYRVMKSEIMQEFAEKARKLGLTVYQAFMKTYLTRYLTLRIFKTSEIEADADLNMGNYTVKSTRMASEDVDMVNFAFMRRYSYLVEILGYRKEGFYHTMANSVGTATLAVGANTLRLLPFLVVRKTRFNGIAVHVTTSASGTNVMLGIYSDNGIYPHRLIRNFGTVDSATTGLKEIAIDLVLEPGLYWLALISNGNPTLGGLDASGTVGILGATTPNASPNNSYVLTLGTQTLPDPFPAGATPARIPYLIALRIANYLE